jgi:ATP-dependent Clp protease ATP-binding subunit ClpX
MKWRQKELLEGPPGAGHEPHPLHHVLPEDVEKFGLIPELPGRLPVIAALDEPGADDVVRSLQEPKDAILGQ